MSKVWDDATMPQLAIVSSTPNLFGRHAMRQGVSGTQLRNRTDKGWRGVVLVLCEGEQVPDQQSLGLFEPLSPSELLNSPAGIALLSQQAPPVALDGNARHVRSAINEAPLATRPSPVAVANYLDRLAAGEDALEALPTIGAYRDSVAPGVRIDSSRISDNLSLAARRTSDELLRASAFADLRKRAETVARRRPGVDNSDARAIADDVMEQLQAGSPDLLKTLQYDEAREVFDQRPRGLPETVKEEMHDFRARLAKDSQAMALPWGRYERRADQLRGGADQRDAAQDLCALDDAQQKAVFTPKTRRKLERLILRNRSISGSNPSCPEAALVQAAEHLGGLIQRVQVINPPKPNDANIHTPTGAGRAITLACARLRLGKLLRAWGAAGGDVDGLLLRSARGDDQDDLGDVLAAFTDAGLDEGARLPTLQLRLYDDSDNTVQVDWRPDLDDAATLRTALLFAEQPVLSLYSPVEPTLHSICGSQEAIPDASVAPKLAHLASYLQQTAETSLEYGLDPTTLSAWTSTWTDACRAAELAGDTDTAEALALAGAVRGPGKATALTPFAPLKAEWLAQYLQALWGLINRAEEPGEDRVEPTAAVATASGIARTTAAHLPAHLRLSSFDRALLPTSEGRIWSLFGGASSRDESGFAGDALRSVVIQLLRLQPEAAGHLRCLAWGPGAADLLVSQAVGLIGTTIDRTQIRRIEVFCVGDNPASRPDRSTLEYADAELRSERDVLELRYISDLDRAQQLLKPGPEAPAVHLALVTGLTDGGNRLMVDSREVEPPAEDAEVLFAPRVWQRPRQDRRTLLMPPATSPSGIAWLRLQNAIEDSWPEPGNRIQVPEVRTGANEVSAQLRQIHDLALWVATLDRYATRDSLEQALGPENVAILHQQKRLGGDSPLSLVLSQRSGGPADRAIGRSLRGAGIIPNRDLALSVGTKLRKVASQGYGILALQAATSGAGINELVGHVVAFSLLATTTTPWPLPPDCRVLLVSLDEYRHWFGGKRADLLAIALDKANEAVHVAAIEIKARRTDADIAGQDALDQLNQTLAATRWAAYPIQGSVHSRLWLNRIAEAAYAVARESRFKLDEAELRALENFRLGRGSLEWAGLGLVFGPHLTQHSRTFRIEVERDIVPVVILNIPLTQQLLERATDTRLTTLRTANTGREPLLASTRTRRRPEAGSGNNRSREAGDEEGAAEAPATTSLADGSVDQVGANTRSSAPSADLAGEELTSAVGIINGDTLSRTAETSDSTRDASSGNLSSGILRSSFVAPVLGWDAATGEPVYWHPAGHQQSVLQNGHMEVWGSSGMGKTQFTMALLAQLSRHGGTHFGIADFKNDYSDQNGFPKFADAKFLDLWNEGAPYNPLALDDTNGADASDREVQSVVIELRDAVEEALRSVNTRLGARQRERLKTALTSAFDVRRSEHRWPTLQTLDDHLDADLQGILGDLTGSALFGAGEPLGDVVDQNIVFGLNKIPGNGATTVLAAGFIFSALLLKVQSLPPVPNTIRYLVVVDEAHRVAPFKAVQVMLREGRSKGLAVILATQGPGDLPDEVALNAQTKICFGLDPTVATMAARRLDPADQRLPEQIRALGAGEAFVKFSGEPPRLLRMAQAWRDAKQLGLPSLDPQPTGSGH
ncbi:hypothetical protein [Branchiibius cervicis]|uniref:ATP-binding protein n=1 Tax=Branchiibius cervicis TaxID=908252 RepID=A0ABW2AUQ9_9MICO